MRNYEIMYIIRPELDEEKTNAVVDKVKGLVENNGGEVTKLDKWGKRRLAYEVEKNVREGFYVLMQFTAGPDVAIEIDRILKISDEVMRHLIVREGE